MFVALILLGSVAAAGGVVFATVDPGDLTSPERVCPPTGTPNAR
ncbi:hypothetical protein HNP84_004401 [Thermocatellispora tengchongensis]|uniref:Uncharacterized protein n=1 Tax=Thermocatellispora tengchongensis TaxID=1073253 RepID=A0A840PBW2_9ACTN|nr:hypothetical protein [Thermocatellispora tengchongensis]